MIFRIASKSEAAEISRLIPQAAKLTELLYRDLIHGKSAQEALQADVAKENTKCSYKNCLIAMEKEMIVGLANFYPSEEHVLTSEMSQKFGKNKIAYIKPIFHTPLPHGFYISALFVAESARGKGVGKKLIHEIKKLGPSLTLHCWVGNHRAMEFYKRAGFVVLEIVDLGRHPMIPYDGKLALLLLS